jgi:3-dehydroquinate dehydratase type I
MPLADAIDVEAKNAIRLREIIEEAKKRGIKVIISGHFLESMPFLIDLVYIVSRYDSFSADILKVAVTIKHPADMRYITNWASSLMEDPLNKYRIAPMAVGRKYGKSSRLMFAKMGAALVYSSLATAVVEGQWNVREISRLLSNNN